MDLHSFRIIATELSNLLGEARVEKIHSPRDGVYVFLLFAQGRKFRLFLRKERKVPLLFFSGYRPENPPQPPARVMRLRKHFSGKRLGRPLVHSGDRCLAFPLLLPRLDDTGAEGEGCSLVWLQLDLVNGADILFDLPGEYGENSRWPPADVVDSLCGPAPRLDAGEEAWQDFPVLTPLLRETLSFLAPLDGRALLIDLEEGGGDFFVYADKSGRAVFYTAWPLPDQALERRSLRPCNLEEATLYAELDNPSLREEESDNWRACLRERFPALYTVSLVDERRFFVDYKSATQKEESLPQKKAAKRLARLMDKLDQEEKRLSGMYALREPAIGLQSVLWQHSPDARLAEVELPGGSLVVLNPLLTVRENMARMFHQSGRGKRGLAMLEQRRADLERSGLAGEGTRNRLSGAGSAKTPEVASGLPGLRAVEGAGGRERANVAGFVSSDGFSLLRGRNAKGNHSLLKIGKGHDLWLHVEEGPGAHVIIRRAHEGELIPETTLMEAAGLAAEKSWQGATQGVRVMYALLRHVHPIKGGGPGMVKVDALAGTLSL